MTADVAVSLATSLAQLGVAAAALKVAMELKAAVLALKEQFANHEGRINSLEKR